MKNTVVTFKEAKQKNEKLSMLTAILIIQQQK